MSRRTRIATAIALVLVVLLAIESCGPASGDELASEPDFAATMPGSTEIASGRADARSGLWGSSKAYAWRLLVTDQDEQAVRNWYHEELGDDGWIRATYGFIAMSDGHSTTMARRRGNRVIGVGFPDRDWLARAGSERVYPEGTLYEVTITDQPPLD
jgi:hypothetical protein